MNRSTSPLQNLVVRSFERLLRLYPPHFRGEFSAEIHAVFLQRMDEAGSGEGRAWLAIAGQELMALSLSILQECWYELWVRMVTMMTTEDSISRGAGGGGAVLQRAGGAGSSGIPGALWAAGWILLSALAFPAALGAAAPLGAIFMWAANLGTKAGFWPAAPISTLVSLGFITSMALAMAAAQTAMLRRSLSRPGFWFAATAAGFWLGGFSTGWYSLGQNTVSENPYGTFVIILLAIGLGLGLAQWLCARKFLRRALWLIPIDLLATASLLLLGETVTSFVELAAALLFPGTITGLGIWLIFRQARPAAAAPILARAEQPKSPWPRRIARVGLWAAVLIPVFFFSIWAYAASQLALAKNEGVYPTVEAAITSRHTQGWGGAQVVGVEDVRASPNRGDGSQPHVWFGAATVKLDRVPAGHTRPEYHVGSFYIHVQEGWVFMGEGAFPEFIGWVMELYHLEGAGAPPQP